MSLFPSLAIRAIGAACRVAFCACTAVSAVHGQTTPTTRGALLVPASWLVQHLRDPDLVLLHVGDKAEYDARHIPGARFVSLDQISASDHGGAGGLMLEMPPSDTLRAHLAGLGISDRSRVIVYYGKDWVTPATRVIHTLEYAGLGAGASLLDGGMLAWIKERNAVTDVVPGTREGTLRTLKLKHVIVDAEFVRAHLGQPGWSVVDGRNGSFYDGVQSGRNMDRSDQRPGHIAGALSVPFTEITDADLRLKSAAELEALFTKAGVKPGDIVIGYCHIGQQATGMLFAARTLGHQVVLYDGSFEDWSRRADFPVENPSAKAKP